MSIDVARERFDRLYDRVDDRLNERPSVLLVLAFVGFVGMTYFDLLKMESVSDLMLFVAVILALEYVIYSDRPGLAVSVCFALMFGVMILYKSVYGPLPEEGEVLAQSGLVGLFSYLSVGSLLFMVMITAFTYSLFGVFDYYEEWRPEGVGEPGLVEEVEE